LGITVKLDGNSSVSGRAVTPRDHSCERQFVAESASAMRTVSSIGRSDGMFVSITTTTAVALVVQPADAHSVASDVNSATREGLRLIKRQCSPRARHISQGFFQPIRSHICAIQGRRRGEKRELGLR
jgi:hypothetical protein